MPRVLVVDDQADVRTMISIVLRIQHIEIVEAESAASALKLFEEAASFDLAIVDIFLQGTNGSDLITALRGHVPGLPVIAISGMTALDFLSETPELSDVVCLQKPFRPPDLMRAIEAARGSRRTAGRCRRSGGAIARPGCTAFIAAGPSSAGLPPGASQAIAVGGDLAAAKPDRRQAAVAAGGPTGSKRGLPGASRIRPGRRAATRCWRSRFWFRTRAIPASRPAARRSPPI